MIVIIAPGNSQDIYQSLSTLSAKEPPIWAAMLYKALRTDGFNCLLFDQEAENLTVDELSEYVTTLEPSLVVVVVYGHQPSASTQTMHAASLLIDKLSEGETDILLVGGHPSALPIETLAKEKCNYVAKGEGLNVIKKMMELDKQHYWKIPGLYIKDHGKIIEPVKGQDKKAENLDVTYPGIFWGQLPMDKYRAHNWHVFGREDTIHSYASIYTSLGCPFKCTFCCINAPFDSHSFRYWSPQHTVSELRTLREDFGVTNLKIADEMFVLREDHFLSICNLLIEQKIKMNIWAYARVDTVKEHHLETLKKAGVNWLALGIESGSQFVRDGVTKGRFKVEDIYKNVKLIQSHGINVIGNYIFGLPDDTEESMKETYEMACELNCEFANFYSAMAYPGSALYITTSREDLPESYVGYSQHSYETKPLRTNACEAKTVLRIRDEAHRNYFERPSYLSMVQKKFGDRALGFVREMNKKSLNRKLLEST